MDHLLGGHIQDAVAPKHCIEVRNFFVRHVSDRFKKYNIPLGLLVAVRTLAEGVNAEFTVMPRSLISAHFCNNLPSASSDRTIRRSGVPPIDM